MQLSIPNSDMERLNPSGTHNVIIKKNIRKLEQKVDNKSLKSFPFKGIMCSKGYQVSRIVVKFIIRHVL